MTIRHEKMRIAGQLVDGDCGSLEVLNPYNGEVVGSVPRAAETIRWDLASIRRTVTRIREPCGT